MTRTYLHLGPFAGRLLASAAFIALAVATAHATQYPPGPGGAFPDTLVYVRFVQDPAQTPNPAVPDTVWGLGGIITAFDIVPVGFAFYIQNRTAGNNPWTGVMVFTGATNYQAPVGSWPGLEVGDSVMVYGRLESFQGETEIIGLTVPFPQPPAAVRVRRVSVGNPLPEFHIGPVNELQELPTNPNAEQWEGCLVRANGPLRVARTSVTGGLGTLNSFLVVDNVVCPNGSVGPCDSLFVDGLSLGTVPLPAVGQAFSYVQGIYTQRTRGYRIELYSAEGMVSGPPNITDAYTVYDNRPTDAGDIGATDTLRVVFDRPVTQASVEDTSHYSLGSLGAVHSATQVAPNAVHLVIQNGLPDGASETIFVNGVVASTNDTLKTAVSRAFVNGVMTISNLQAPDPTALAGPCDDRSRYAGAGTTPGARLSFRGVCTKGFQSLYYLQDQSAPTRNGVALFAPASALVPGRQYLVAGAVQEFSGETEAAQSVYLRDEGPATAPSPVLQTIAAIEDATCDENQNISNGEDFEGMLVRVDHAMIAGEYAPGQNFLIVGPFGVFSDTIRVSNDNSYTYDPDSLRVINVNGVLRWRFGSWEVFPRADTDIEDPPISQITPSHGGDVGPVSVVITGFGFESGATTKLARSGQPDIAGSQVSVASDGRSLAATFDLTGRVQGLWDVVVVNPDSQMSALPDGFTIEGAAPHQLRVDVVGPALMRPNRRKAFDIVLENLGNSDVHAVPLWITRIPVGATVEPDFSLTPPPQSGGEPDWSQAPLVFTGPGGKYLALVIPRVPPGVTVRRLYLTVPNTVTSFELDAALAPPWADGALFRSCLAGAGVIQAPACMGTQLNAINEYLATTPGIEALSGIGLWAKVAWQCEGAANLSAALAKAEQVLDLMLEPVEQSAVPTGCEVALVPLWLDALAIGIVTSVDPNDKLGADGVGVNRQIGSEQILPYSIRFENKDNASAPAQTVVVTDALDGSKLDLATVSLGPIKFGKRTNGLPWAVYPPPGLGTYTTNVNLLPEKNLIVRVAVNLDQATGVLGWSLTSIDPATGLPPVNPLVGFLPPNVNPPEGEGSLLFTVLPKAGLADSTVIRNRATLDFDGAVTLTPEWSNTLDDVLPESEVLDLGATQDSASFTVHWAPIGSPPDLRDYSVYVSENGGAYRAWRTFTTATADTITAPGGRTYAFYSLARDLSGNLEAVPGTPDAQTYSRVAVEGPQALGLSLEGAVPNPALGPARVWFTLPSRERAVLEVMDIAGRRVLRREVGALGPGRHSVEVSGSVRRPGLYFLRLAQGNRELRARMAVIR